MLGKKALVVPAILSRIMEAKTEEPYLHVQGWVKCRILIVVAIPYSCMILSVYLPGLLQDWGPD